MDVINNLRKSSVQISNESSSHSLNLDPGCKSIVMDDPDDLRMQNKLITPYTKDFDEAQIYSVNHGNISGSMVGSKDKRGGRSSAPLKDSSHDAHEVRNSIIAGSIAGMTSCTLFHPLDVIRTKMQATTKLKTVENSRKLPIKPGSRIMKLSSINSSSGPLAFFSHTLKNGGMKAIYTGFSFPLAAQACYKSTIFTVNKLSQNAIVDYRSKEQPKAGGTSCFPSHTLTLFEHFLCGFISGSVNALVFVSPVEFIRSQLIHQHTSIAQGKGPIKGEMTGPLDVIKRTLKTGGLFGLWRGAGVTFARDSIGCGSFFVSFELGKKYLPLITEVEPASQLHTIGAGMLAGIGYWAMTLPLDALKTLVQTGKANSALDTLSLLINRDGIVKTADQLYRGWQLAFGRGAPSAGVTVMTYSAVYDFCQGKK
jgi:Mitochondrial carrier protein.